LQTAALEGVKLWDLRKFRNVKTFSPYDSDTPTNTGEELIRLTLIMACGLIGYNHMMCNFFCPAVEFDFSGSYLAIGGSDIRYVLVKLY
jgi:pre-mRNA-processing factor 19